MSPKVEITKEESDEGWWSDFELEAAAGGYLLLYHHYVRSVGWSGWLPGADEAAAGT